MCRIILLIDTPITINHIKNDQINNDGFGIAYSYNDQHYVYHSLINCECDLNINTLFPLIRNSKWVLIHHRKGTNKEISLYNCHPFTYDNITFAHVGECAIHYNDRKKIINEIDDKLLLMIKGNTDTEYLFYLIVTKYMQLNNVKLAISSAINVISTYDCCINAILVIEAHIYIISYNNYLQNSSYFYYDSYKQILETIDHDTQISIANNDILIKPTDQLQIWHFEKKKLLQIM